MLNQFLNRLAKEPQSVEFTDAMSVIDQHYDFTPTDFSNGDIKNAPGQNSGSCKIFAFSQMNNLSKDQTLACFGHYYREHVLENPEGDDHQNIRQFMRHGWAGIFIDGEPLKEK
ncbi:HopJ type III effector protein [Parendozoicomonas sp. Alg238-R29]|uniref:HopJ type III effector protein n=1 Tax=Parendozoicomonas sp. Alg238-R29 TaxID=2993446 RepID=UPI00248E1566|nr:HopJ type III effector protein [Parendozoicomonas sp. Alg238-R29]